MKVYQIHTESGEWEDYSNDIVGTYLHKKKAEKELRYLINQERRLRYYAIKCKRCWSREPFYRYNCFDEDECYCKNEFYHYDKIHYKIVEVEVIE